MSLAVAATLSLAALEVMEPSEEGGRRPAVRTVVASTPASARQDPRPSAAFPAPALGGGVAAARPAHDGQRARPASAAPSVTSIEPRVTPVRETAAVLRSSDHLVRLVVASDLRSRLDIVTAITNELGPADAADALAGLLDSELPGDFYEAQTLRLGVMAALGRLPAHEVSETLAGRLAPTWPRQERLLAIELLVRRDDVRRGELVAIAERDPDAQVRDKARWALRRLD
jgi:hypothetical protein